MKLLLTSNGLLNTPLEKDFLEMTDHRTNLTVAIIPTANDPIEWYPEHEGDDTNLYVYRLLSDTSGEHSAWLREYQAVWEGKGYRVVVADLKDDPAALRQKLESADVIDVLGGDINYLLDWAKKSKLDTYLKSLLESGVVYVGTSAGSGLVTPDIGLTWWELGWKLDHIGLGIVDFIVVPHQKDDDAQKSVEQLTKRRAYLQTIVDFPWRMYLVQDGQAIKIVDDRVEHIGSGVKRCIS